MTVANIRYADDLVVCASSREKIEEAQAIIAKWLQVRGLALHPEKTRIVHIDDGFNFLGFSIRRYRGKCLIKPQKDKVLTFLSNQRSWLNKHKQVTAESVIRHLNPILRGWANNYKHVVSKQVLSYVSSQMWRMLWKWCLRRHQEKGKYWVQKKYFREHKNVRWTFYAKTADEFLHLFDVGAVQIERHIKVRSGANPDDPTLQDYWVTRRETRLKRPLVKEKALRKYGLDARAG